MSKITTHFDIKEFMVSAQYPHLAKDIVLTELDLYKLFLICTFVLEPLRKEFGKIIITSGKRTEELNKMVGGVKNSQHLFLGHDAAVDFYTAEEELKTAFHYIISKMPNLYCFLTLYYHKDFKSNFIHFGLAAPDRNNGVIAYYFDGKYFNKDPEKFIISQDT